MANCLILLVCFNLFIAIAYGFPKPLRVNVTDKLIKTATESGILRKKFNIPESIDIIYLDEGLVDDNLESNVYDNAIEVQESKVYDSEDYASKGAYEYPEDHDEDISKESGTTGLNDEE